MDEHFIVPGLDTMPESIRKAVEAGQVTNEMMDQLREAEALLIDGRETDCISKLVELNEAAGENPFVDRCIGAVLYASGHKHQAFNIYLNLNRRYPSEPDILHSIALLLRELGEKDEALDLITKLIKIDARPSHFWMTAGLCSRDLEDYETARVCFEEASRLDPMDPSAHANAGWLDRELGELKSAAAHYDVVLAMAPDSLMGRFNASFVRMAMGDYERAWDLYETRTNKGSHAYSNRDRHFPLWEDGSVAGKTVLIAAEQGIGDQLMFARYADYVLEDAKEVVIECHRKLLPLFERAFPGREIRTQIFSLDGKTLRGCFPWLDATPDRFDLMLNMGSLFRYARQTRGGWPARPPTFRADPGKAAIWAERIAALGDGPKVGVIWRSQSSAGERSHAYAPLARYVPILRRAQAAGAKLVSLQYSDWQSGIDELRDAYGIDVTHFSDIDHYDDVDTVAAMIDGLDFVLGARTAPLMLAAAIGIPALAIHRGTPWAGPLADGFDPWLPPLRTAAAVEWDQTFAQADEILGEWLARCAAGEPIVPSR